MTYSQKISWAFVSAIAVSVCWLIGDIYVVGFKPDPGDYPLFSKDYADKVDVDLAVHMLTGSTQRLMFGALIGALTTPLLLPAMWLVYQFFPDRKKWYALLTYYVLLAGVTLSPLAHSGFFYVGEIHKAILHTDRSAHPYLLETAGGFTQMLHIAWISAISVLAAGWLLFTIFVFAGKTVLPRWAGLLTPVFLTFLQHPLVEFLPGPLPALLSGAGFNIAYLLFFVFLLFAGKKRLSA